MHSKKTKKKNIPHKNEERCDEDSIQDVLNKQQPYTDVFRASLATNRKDTSNDQLSIRRNQNIRLQIFKNNNDDEREMRASIIVMKR